MIHQFFKALDEIIQVIDRVLDRVGRNLSENLVCREGEIQTLFQLRRVGETMLLGKVFDVLLGDELLEVGHAARSSFLCNHPSDRYLLFAFVQDDPDAAMIIMKTQRITARCGCRR